MEAIEEACLERQLPAQFVDFLSPSEAAHRRLERQRAAGAVEPDHLAVEDQGAGGHRDGGFDHFRDAGRDIVVLPREDGHLRARLVDLHARAVHLVVEHGTLQGIDGAADILGGLREHGLYRRAEGQAHAAQSRCAVTHGDGGDMSQVRAQHVGAPDVGATALGRLGDRLHHDAVEGPLAQLADEQPDQEPQLVGNASPEEGS